MFDLNKIDACFPKESYRPGQRECIEFAINSFNAGKKIVVLECPTGSGKSSIAKTLANMVNNSYYLTSSKQLQDQLVNDFNDMVDLKGRNAYPCTYWSRRYRTLVNNKAISSNAINNIIAQNPMCDSGYCKRGLHYDEHNENAFCKGCFLSTPAPNKPVGDLNVLPDGMKHSACPYFEKLYTALAAPQVVMNFHNFIMQTMIGRFMTRDLLIIDEAHNQESIMMDFVSLTLSDAKLKKYGIVIPDLPSFDLYINWMRNVDVRGALVKAHQFSIEHKKPKDTEQLMDMIVGYDKLMDRIRDGGIEWVAQFESFNNINKVVFKPVFVKKFVHDLLYKYGRNILMMSATILDAKVFCNSLGIDRSHAALKRIKSSFPVENRPIYYQPVAKLTGGPNQSGQWMPKVVSKVNEIVRKHAGQRGIIHTHNFNISTALLQQCDPDVKCRFLDQRNFLDKTQMLDHHALCEDTVIVAPAMHEGVDLMGDLSRFQILCKIPYPNFYNDKQLARRKELDPDFYSWLTVLKLVQSVGRSVRSDTDYADTYVIDGSFDNVLNFNKSMLPPSFLEAIKR